MLENNPNYGTIQCKSKFIRLTADEEKACKGRNSFPGDLKVNESNAEYLVRKLSRVDQQLESLDKLAGLFLQLSTERGGRVAIAYAECADLLAKTVSEIRKNK